MRFQPTLKKATLVRRYKRFLADVILDGETITVHCPNTGSMKNCVVEGAPCWLLDSQNPKRKYRFGWELATTPLGHLAGINTQRANNLVEEALKNQFIKELVGYDKIEREKKYGQGSRVDFLLSGAELRNCYVEVKSVTLEAGEGVGLFPDAKSERATKHLNELMRVKAEGDRAVLLFCVQHNGIDCVKPAELIDPVYAKTLRQAYSVGVEIFAYGAHIDHETIALNRVVEVAL